MAIKLSTNVPNLKQLQNKFLKVKLRAVRHKNAVTVTKTVVLYLFKKSLIQIRCIL